MTIAEQLHILNTRTINTLPGGCTASAEPIRSLSKVVNGQKVTCKVIGFVGRTVFEVPFITGTKPLTLAQAADILGR